MLTRRELDSIDDCMKDVYNLIVTVSQKQTNGTWSSVLTNVPAMISPANSWERARGSDLYGKPVDATLRMARSTMVVIGMKVAVTTVQGSTATTDEALEYQVLTRDDLLSFGRHMECKLWRMTQ